MSYYHSSGHICGLYYNIPTNYFRTEKVYLPQVELQAHATILSTTSRTVLKQTFLNPSTNKAIREVRYTFPLYDGVSVVGFTCHVGDRTIVGEVKEKEKAKAVFKAAVANGQTAGLFEQLPEASDVFTTTVGNIPPGAKVVVEITYLGELKHDMEVDGIRFTIPNIICPRYGSYRTEFQLNRAAQQALGSGISITIDADMADGSFIQKIQSPTHPISMTMGTTSLAPDAEPTMSKASASLALGTAELEKDFVVQIIAKNTGTPKAVLETHPTIPNHKALMATLVPKFALPPEKPELVFVCDRSGSMGGSNMRLVIQALKVFLKSLPVGVKFNICSFGSSYSFLWPKSVTYSQATLDEANRHAESFDANYGGTEMLQPIKATIEQRYSDMPLDVVLLTDGEIWNQNELFSYLNESVQDSKAPIRVFTLGIGNGVSHALIEGVAKAGNGFSQSVGDGEKMDTKVVRMLKGALSPHINDYSLEVKYADASDDAQDSDFDLVERVRDSLKVNLKIDDAAAKPTTKKPISLFDSSADPDQEEAAAPDDTGEGRYAHLPGIAVPKIIQAPQNIPSLFAFNRTTVYLLLGPDAPKAKPTSIMLRGTSAHGPLELEIAVQSLEESGETIHQLAAKKAISELEQGRGWLPQAKDENNTDLKTRFEGRFDEMVEREAVRLGVQFQVGGKWCSFVAVESIKRKKEQQTEDWEFIEDEAKTHNNPSGSSWNTSEGLDDLIGSGHSRPKKRVANRFVDLEADVDSEEEDDDNMFIDQEARVDSKEEDDDDGSTVELSGRFSRDTASASEDECFEPPVKYLAKVDPKTGAPSRGGMDALGAATDGSTNLQSVINTRESTFEANAIESEADLNLSGALNSQIYVPQPNPGRPLSSGPAPSFGSPSVAPFNRSGYNSFGGSALMSTGNSQATSWAQQHQQQQVSSQGAGNPSYGNHALQDHQMGLMLLEQQNKKRLLMARQEQDTTQESGTQSLKDYMTGLMVLRQDNPRRLQMGPQVQQSSQSVPQPTQQMQQMQQSSHSVPPPPPGGPSFGSALPRDHVLQQQVPAYAQQQTQQIMAQQQAQAQQQTQQGRAMAMMQSASFPPPPGGAEAFGHGAPSGYTMTNCGDGTSSTNAPLSIPSFGGPPPMPASFGGAPPPPSLTPAGPPFGAISEADPGFDLGLDFDGDSQLENFDFDSFLHKNNDSDFAAFGAGNFDFATEHMSQETPQDNTAQQSRKNASNLRSSRTVSAPAKTPEELSHYLISLQTFEGSWELSAALLAALKIEETQVNTMCAEQSLKPTVLVTALVVAVFERKLKDLEGTWELVVEKAKGWLESQEVGDVESMVEKVGGLIK